MNSVHECAHADLQSASMMAHQQETSSGVASGGDSIVARDQTGARSRAPPKKEETCSRGKKSARLQPLSVNSFLWNPEDQQLTANESVADPGVDNEVSCSPVATRPHQQEDTNESKWYKSYMLTFMSGLTVGMALVPFLTGYLRTPTSETPIVGQSSDAFSILILILGTGTTFATYLFKRLFLSDAEFSLVYKKPVAFKVSKKEKWEDAHNNLDNFIVVPKFPGKPLKR